jgi:hypothetical protein
MGGTGAELRPIRPRIHKLKGRGHDIELEIGGVVGPSPFLRSSSGAHHEGGGGVAAGADADRRWRASRHRASARSCITRPNHGSPACRRTTAIRDPPPLLGRCQISVLVRRRWARLSSRLPIIDFICSARGPPYQCRRRAKCAIQFCGVPRRCDRSACGALNAPRAVTDSRQR